MLMTKKAGEFANHSIRYDSQILRPFLFWSTPLGSFQNEMSDKEASWTFCERDKSPVNKMFSVPTKSIAHFGRLPGEVGAPQRCTLLQLSCPEDRPPEIWLCRDGLLVFELSHCMNTGFAAKRLYKFCLIDYDGDAYPRVFELVFNKTILARDCAFEVII